MLSLTCPGCGRTLRFKEELAGKKIRCPRCPQIIPVPAAAARPVSAATSVGASAQTPAIKSDARSQTYTLPGAPIPAADPDAATKSPHDLGDSTIEAPRTGKPPTRPDGELTDFLAPAEAPDELGRLGGYRVLEVLGRVTVLKDRDITLGGFPGTEVVVDNVENRCILTLRIYTVRRRGYTLLASGPPDKPDAPEVQRFLTSFRLTPGK